MKTRGCLSIQLSGTPVNISIDRAAFRLGLCIYVLSFFLVAIDDVNKFVGRMLGYQCAYSVIHAALTTTPFSPNSPDYAPPFIYFSTLITALINPVFLAYVTLRFLKRTSRTTRPLKFVLLSMIPFSWVVLRNLEVYPREGHIFWVVGMLLVLFSGWIEVPNS
jgi:hypothetical protein